MPHVASTPTPLTALERMRHWWRRIASSVLPSLDETTERTTPRLVESIKPLLAESRAQRGGEMAARRRAESIAAAYRAADTRQRAAMLNLITHEFAPDRDELERAIAAIRTAINDVELSRAEARLRIALDAPRATFLTQFNLLADGVKFLVDLRADLLDLLPKEPALEVLKVELDGLLERWFDPGFLELRRITWQSPALILEKLMAYEAVHPIASWSDLRNRLDTDRRCYAFFHPRLPEEPLIFVEIALLKGMPVTVQALLDEKAPVQDPATADTAIFYSISSTQKGLRGISFGNLLLKRVIEALQQDLARLQVFATLSPIPGFRRWLESALADRRPLLPAADRAKLATAVGHANPDTVLADVLARESWHSDSRMTDALREPMEKLCARYLLQEKSGSQPLDAVAHFHLSNGAHVSRIFWLADTSARGLSQSCGLMVSYRYALSEVDRNHEQFLHNGRVPAARRVQRLLT
jgi:malonyl-CoA decarboxylase